MSDTFDPYLQWLGVPSDEQPADYYRLLGLKRFETNREVICHAADLRMARIRSYENGEHDQHAQRLLGEIAKAVGCLLNPSRKAIYDQDLRSAHVATQHERAMLPPTANELAHERWRNRTNIEPPPRSRASSSSIRTAVISLLISSAVMAILSLAGFMWFVS
jgi:hypothetical protein